MASSGVKQVVWASLGVLSQGVGRLVTNVLVGRVGGATVLGSMATVQAVAQVMVTFWPGSLGSTGVKFIAQARGRGEAPAITRIQGHLALRSLQGCLLLGVAGAAVLALTGGSALESVASALVVLGLGSYALVQGLLYAERRTLTSSLREAAAAVFNLVVVGALLLHDPSTPGAWLALPLAASMLIYSAVGWPRTRPRSMRREGRELDLFTVTSAVGSLSSQGFIQLSVVMASTIGRDSAGQFSVGLALCTPLTLVVTPLGLALFPALNEAMGRGDSDAVRRQITVATHFLAFALLAGGGFMVLVRSVVIFAVWGPEFHEAASIFVPLVSASALVAVALPATNGMTSSSQRHATRATLWSVGSSLVGGAAWFALVPGLHTLGVALGLLIGRLVYAVAVLESARKLHALPSWLGLALRCALIAATVTVLDLVGLPVVLAVGVFVIVVVVVVSSDSAMRTFVKEQGSWLAHR